MSRKIEDTALRIKDWIARRTFVSCVITGQFGSGKSHVMKYLAPSLEAMGFTVFFPPPQPGPEILKYDPFNRLLDSLTGTQKVRELSEILQTTEKICSPEKKIAMIIEGVNLLSDPTRYLFNYFSRLSGKYGLTLIATLDTDRYLWNGDVTGFLDTCRMEGTAQIVEMGKPSVEDFSSYLSGAGYRLDASFVNDLYRLADGNFRILDYSLKYYTFKGIIGKDGRINESLYRSFLIPAGISQFYAGIMNECDMESLRILALLSLSEAGIHIGTMRSILSTDDKTITGSVNKLVSQGLAVRYLDVVSFPSYFLKKYTADRIPSDIVRKTATDASRSVTFRDLPLQSRINILKSCQDFDSLASLIRNEWRTFVRKFTSVGDLQDFAREMMGKFAEPDINSILNLILCNAIYNSDDLEGARSCYEQLSSDNIDPISTQLTLSSIYSAQGNHEMAIRTLKRMMDGKISDPELMAAIYASLSEEYFSSDEPTKSREFAEKAISISESNGLQEIIARSMTALGNIEAGLGNYDAALGHYFKSLEINRNLGIWLQITRNLNNISAVHEYMGEYGLSLQETDDLIGYTYLTGDRTMRGATLLNRAYVLDILGKPAEAGKLAYVSSRISERLSNPTQAFKGSMLAYFCALKSLDLKEALVNAERCVSLSSSTGTRGTREFSIALRHIGRFLNGDVMDAGDEDLLKNQYSLEPRDAVQYHYLVSLYYVIRGNLYSASDSFNLAVESAHSGLEPYFDDLATAFLVLNLFFVSNFSDMQRTVDECGGKTAFLESVIEGCRLVLLYRNGGDLRDVWIRGEKFSETVEGKALGPMPLAMLTYYIIQNGNTHDLQILPTGSMLKKLPSPVSSYFRIRIIDRGINS